MNDGGRKRKGDPKIPGGKRRTSARVISLPEGEVRTDGKRKPSEIPWVPWMLKRLQDPAGGRADMSHLTQVNGQVRADRKNFDLVHSDGLGGAHTCAPAGGFVPVEPVAPLFNVRANADQCFLPALAFGFGCLDFMSDSIRQFLISPDPYSLSRYLKENFQLQKRKNLNGKALEVMGQRWGMWLLLSKLVSKPVLHYSVWCGRKGILFTGSQWMSVSTETDRGSKEAAIAFFRSADLADIRSVSLLKIKK